MSEPTPRRVVERIVDLTIQNGDDLENAIHLLRFYEKAVRANKMEFVMELWASKSCPTEKGGTP